MMLADVLELEAIVLRWSPDSRSSTKVWILLSWAELGWRREGRCRCCNTAWEELNEVGMRLEWTGVWSLRDREARKCSSMIFCLEGWSDCLSNLQHSSVIDSAEAEEEDVEPSSDPVEVLTEAVQEKRLSMWRES